MRIFDAHCDTLTYLIDHNTTLAESDGMIRHDMLTKYDGYIQIFAAWIDRRKENSTLEALTIADKFRSETEKYGITPITDRESLLRVHENGGIGAIFAIEDGAALGGREEALNMFHRLGARAITLTWNGENELGKGALGSDGAGLTDFGKAVVRRMNELGMVIDVSHLSERGFYDVAEISDSPFMASHSNAKAVCDHARNLTDDQLRVMIKTGSAVGINLYTEFLGDKRAGIKDVIRHIEHILALGGKDILGIGTDFDGISKAAKGIESADKLAVLLNELGKLNYPDDLIKKIAYGNYFDLFMKVLK